jgi:hypothetical protein
MLGQAKGCQKNSRIKGEKYGQLRLACPGNKHPLWPNQQGTYKEHKEEKAQSESMSYLNVNLIILNQHPVQF